MVASTTSTSLIDTTLHFRAGVPYPVQQLLRLTDSEEEYAKLARCALNWRYYLNSQYERTFMQMAEQRTDGVWIAKDTTYESRGAAIQAAKELWKGTRPLFSVASTAVDVDRRLCFKNARPVPVKKDPALEQRFFDKWERDRWKRRNRRSPLYGAVTGQSHLRVIPGELDGNPLAPSRLSVYSPEIMTTLRDQHDYSRLIGAKIEYRYVDRKGPRTMVGGAGAFGSMLGSLLTQGMAEVQSAVGLAPDEEIAVYTMIITEEAYYTFRNHTPFAFDSDLGNSWENRLGKVPVVDVPFNDIGLPLGLPTFESILPAIDAVNEMLSKWNAILNIHADPVILAYGLQPDKEGKPTFTKQITADGTNVWFVSTQPIFTQNQIAAQPRVEFLEYKGGATASLLEYLQMVKADVEAALPEAAYKKAARKSGSARESEIDLQPLEDKLGEIRETHFDAAEDAMQMALVADDLAAGRLTTGNVREAIEEARSKYDLTFHADPVLPLDRATEAQIINVLKADNIISERGAMERAGMTFRQIEEEQAQKEQEHKDFLRRERERLALYAEFGMKAPAPPNGQSRPSPNATQQTQQGQAVRAANGATRNQPNTNPNSRRD